MRYLRVVLHSGKYDIWDSIPGGARDFFKKFQSVSVAHLDTYCLSAGSSFSKGKVTRVWSWPLTTIIRNFVPSIPKNFSSLSTCSCFIQLLYPLMKCQVGCGSAVGIVTRHGLDGQGIESRWGRDFLHPSRPALGPTQPPVQWIPEEKRPRGGAQHPSKCRGQERVGLCLYSPFGPSWPVMGEHLPLFTFWWSANKARNV